MPTASREKFMFCRKFLKSRERRNGRASDKDSDLGSDERSMFLIANSHVNVRSHCRVIIKSACCKSLSFLTSYIHFSSISSSCFFSIQSAVTLVCNASFVQKSTKSESTSKKVWIMLFHPFSIAESREGSGSGRLSRGGRQIGLNA